MSACRWSLDCDAPATKTIAHGSLGTIDSCAEHAADWNQWFESSAINAQEPEPECWCPDSFIANGVPVDYCPTHGTPEQRGIESL